MSKILHNFATMKCLCMIRVSTERQQLEDQHREMEVFCKGEGYDEIVFVEDRGASAIKLNDSYSLMIEQVKEEIEKDSTIRCFAVWELSRAFRNELVFQQVKQFLVERRVQFMVKNPYLKLLNTDGSVNPGMEVAVTLMATLAKQEMEIKKERFHRAKKAMREQGRFIGGRCTKLGYKVGDGGYIEIDEEVAPLVRLIFEMYSTGKWSVRTLYDELKERGYDINYHLVNSIVADRSYIAGPYPQMISQELWDKCEKVRGDNFLFIPKGKKYCFGSGIFKCSVCGRYMVAEGAQYRCWHHNRYAAPPHCTNGLTIRVENLDGLLWWISSKEEIKYRMKMDADKKKEYESQVDVLMEKVAATQKKLDSLEEKRNRIKELYVEGMISKEELKIKSNKTLSEAKIYNDTILSLKEKIEGFLTLLEGNDEDKITEERLKSLYLGVLDEKDLKMMQEIVKKHISKVTSSPEWFGKERDQRAVRQNAQMITVETVVGDVQKYIYVARKYKGHRFFFYKEDGSEVPVLSVPKIKRESIGVSDPRAFKKLKDW